MAGGRYTLSQMTATAKRALRDWALETRAAEMAARGPDLSASVVHALRGCAAYQRAGVVAAYMAFRSEVDLSELLEDSKRFALPRTHGRPEPHLTLHEVTGLLEDRGEWPRHRHGQLEPPDTAPELAPEAVDMFIVPGVAFDVTGARLGYGLGYYDRLLPRARPGAVVVGVTLDVLVLPELPRQPHDARVAYLVTETGWREAMRVSSHVG